MTDKEIIRELEQKLSNKRKESDELQKTIKSQKEELKILNYTLYEERNLTTDLAKANLKISALKRDLNSVKDRFKHENQQNKEIIKTKEQECERLTSSLLEIEEIARNMNTSCFYDDFDCKDCDMKNGCIFLGKLKILQKIKECEVKNEK